MHCLKWLPQMLAIVLGQGPAQVEQNNAHLLKRQGDSQSRAEHSAALLAVRDSILDEDT